MKKYLKRTIGIAILCAVFFLLECNGFPLTPWTIQVSAATSITSGTTSSYSYTDAEAGYTLYFYLPNYYKHEVHICGCTTTKNQVTVTIPDMITNNSISLKTQESTPNYDFKITGITDSAFANQTNIKEVTGLKYVEYIGEQAFLGCTQLEKLSQTNAAKRSGDYRIRIIGNRAFKYCYMLNNIDNAFFAVTSIGNDAFAHCGTLSNSSSGIALPDTLEYLGDGAFRESKIQKVFISANIEKISENCFYNCTQLSDVNFVSNASANALKEIGNYAFVNTAFKKIAIPKGVEIIGNRAFRSCSLLETVYLPDSITLIDSGAFKYCQKLKATSDYPAYNNLSRTIFTQEVIIHDEAFCNTGLGGVIFLKKATIGARAFLNCPNMKFADIVDANSSLDTKCLGYLDENTRISGFKMYGFPLLNYAANNGFAYVPYKTSVSYNDYMWGTENRDYSYGKDTYYYINQTNSNNLNTLLGNTTNYVTEYNKQKFRGVCTGLAALSIMNYTGYYNILNDVPLMYKPDGSCVTKLADVTRDNITDSLRSAITYYWIAANAQHHYDIKPVQNSSSDKSDFSLLFEYCRLMNTGLVKPCILSVNIQGSENGHAVAIYGAELKSDALNASNQDYWNYEKNGKSIAFDARIRIYDDNYSYKNGVVDQGWGGPTYPYEYTDLYINTQTGECCWRQKNYLINGVSDESTFSTLAIIPYEHIITIPAPTYTN